MKKKNTAKPKRLAGWVVPNQKNYKTESGWLKGIYALNKGNFDSYQQFKKTAAPEIIKAATTETTGRYALRVPKGKMSEDDYKRAVFDLNKDKIVKAYREFSGRENVNAETAFERFKQEYNLRKDYIYGMTKKKDFNTRKGRKQIIDSLQRSDFFNTTDVRQRFSVLETMQTIETGFRKTVKQKFRVKTEEKGAYSYIEKEVKKGKKKSLLDDFLRDTGYSNMHEAVESQDIDHYYIYGREEYAPGRRRGVTTYLWKGRDGSLWQVVITESPAEIFYNKIGESEI